MTRATRENEKKNENARLRTARSAPTRKPLFGGVARPFFAPRALPPLPEIRLKKLVCLFDPHCASALDFGTIITLLSSRYGLATPRQ